MVVAAALVIQHIAQMAETADLAAVAVAVLVAVAVGAQTETPAWAVRQ